MALLEVPNELGQETEDTSSIVKSFQRGTISVEAGSGVSVSIAPVSLVKSIVIGLGGECSASLLSEKEIFLKNNGSTNRLATWQVIEFK